jgi:hypothetical protein
MRVTAGEFLEGLRFLSGLPPLLRHPVAVSEARAALRRRLAEREASFLALMRRAVYARPSSPYLPLLRQAGCEYGDLERLVTLDGLDSALRTLLGHGVYLRAPELKGLQGILRGSLTLRPDACRFRNPDAGAHVRGQTSGSRGARFGVPLDLGFVRARAVNYALFAAHLLPERTAHASWKTPGGDVFDNLLCFASFGAVPDRWFLQVDPAAPELHPAYRWSVRAFQVGGRLAGIRLPRPEVVPFEDPSPIARWMAGTLRARATPHLQVFTSAAVRLCEAAASAGLETR